ncbi:MAG: hypothetical protein LBG67_00015, partial [Campylobacteraceae bacterium]|nr:hypothetical protein [Campylobacteraceae bacterium]
MIAETKLLTIKEAAYWASGYIDKNVTTSNIAYLIQYGLIRKIGENGNMQVLQTELKEYYERYLTSREKNNTDIYLGDCKDILKTISDSSVDLIITSPPYADQRKATYGGISPDKYVEWFLPISK